MNTVFVLFGCDEHETLLAVTDTQQLAKDMAQTKQVKPLIWDEGGFNHLIATCVFGAYYRFYRIVETQVFERIIEMPVKLP